MNDQLDSNYGNDMRLDPDGQRSMRTVAYWGRFLAIVGFVTTGFMVLMAFFAGSILSSLSSSPYDEMGDMGAMGDVMSSMLAGIYVVLALVYLYPTYKLYLFSTKALKALDAGDNETLSYAMSNLASCFKFIGIATAIAIGFYLVMFGFGILFASFGLS